MNNRRPALLVAAFLLVVTERAGAHALDAYVQQILIELEAKRIVLHVVLTPGVEVAPAVLGAIDTDHDGALSDTERASYTERVRRDLSMSLDGAPVELRVTSADYPEPAAMTRGLGSIALTFEGDASGGLRSAPLHLENHHAPASSQYLVNMLLPRTPRIHVGVQRRNVDQSTYDVPVIVDGTSRTSPERSTLFALVAVVVAAVASIAGVRKWRRRGPSVSSVRSRH